MLTFRDQNQTKQQQSSSQRTTREKSHVADGEKTQLTLFIRQTAAITAVDSDSLLPEEGWSITQ